MHRVLHVTTAGDRARADTRDALVDRLRDRTHQFLHIDGRACVAPPSSTNIYVPRRLPWIAAARVARAIDAARPDVVHVWSADAIGRVIFAVPRTIPCLVEFDLSSSAASAAKHFHALTDAAVDSASVPPGERIAAHAGAITPDPSPDHAAPSNDSTPPRLQFLCPTSHARAHLVKRGVPARACSVIRDSVDFGRINEARRSDVRSRLALHSDDRAVLVLPPIGRDSGAMIAMWGALLAHVVDSRIRIVVPGTGIDADRLRRLADSIGFRSVLRFCGDEHPLVDLLSAANVAVHVPDADGPVFALPWAMASAVPIVASAVPSVTEMLADRHNAWLCRAGEARGAARRILAALDSAEQSRDFATLARAQAFDVFGRQRMIRQYETAYGNLAAGRWISDNIVDSAIIR